MEKRVTSMAKKWFSKSIGLFAALWFIFPLTSYAATVDVIGEANLSDTTLSVNIYANTAANILSFGINLNYSASDLSVTSVQRNNDAWYFGNASTTYPYISPDSSTQGKVTIIGGLLDTGNPTGGVTGQRILLATVNFNRKTAYAPSLSLSYGKAAPYKNFVSTSGTVYDDASQGVSFSVGFGSSCFQCTGDPVELEGVTFEAGTACECTASTSITIGPNVIIRKGANITFKAPEIIVKNWFKAENGSVVKMQQ